MEALKVMDTFFVRTCKQFFDWLDYLGVPEIGALTGLVISSFVIIIITYMEDKPSELHVVVN